MSLVIAFKYNDIIYMGADTQTTSGNYIEKYKTYEENFKITKMPNDILLGHVGSVVLTQQLYSQKKWFEQLPAEGLTKKFIVKNIIPKLYNKFYIKDLLEDGNTMLSSFVLAWRNRLFYIASNFEVYELDDFIAIGSGRSCALYYALKQTSVREKILNCLNAANNFCNTVCNPFILIDTKELKFEIVGDEV